LHTGLITVCGTPTPRRWPWRWDNNRFTLPYQDSQLWQLGDNHVAIRAVNGAGLAGRRTLTIIVVGGRTYLPLIRAE